MLDRLIAQKISGAKRSVLLIGPRQTGKSTLVHGLRPDLEINLAREAELLTFLANPGELEQRITAQHAKTVFLDEVQRLPSLLNTVQALVDEAKRDGRQLKFLLTGSSARKLRRGGANLLAGRILLFHLGPLAAAEIGDSFDVRRALEMGTLPEPYLEQDRSLGEKILQAYGGTYLKEEIQAEALSRKLEGFSRFIMVAAATSGGWLDFSKLAQNARVSRTSTVRYFELLEETLLARRVFPYPAAPRADLVKHPKLYFFDCGVLNGLLGNFVASADRIGNLFEHLLVCQLQALAMAHDKEIEIHTFRTRGGLEVDFVVRIGKQTWAIEAKASTNIREHDADGLEAASSHFPDGTRRVIVTLGGASRRFRNGVEVLAMSVFLKELDFS